MSAYPDDMDPECIPICDAINAHPGLLTHESCCGHGRTPFRVFFIAGALADLAPLLETLSNGWPWRVHAGWANGNGVVYFCLEGEIGHPEYADQLAEQLLADLADEHPDLLASK